MSNTSIWPIDRTLSGAITPGQSGPGSDGNEGTVYFPQSSSTTGASTSDCLVSYPGHLLGESYSSAEMQLVYSAFPTNWAKNIYVTLQVTKHMHTRIYIYMYVWDLIIILIST